MNIVQLIRNGGKRCVALVDGEVLRPLSPDSAESVYALAMQAIKGGIALQDMVRRSVGGGTIAYDAVYQGESEWRLLPSFDHPGDAARCMVSGTGLTHKTGAENRAAMHKQAVGEVTDSMRMYRMGLEGGRPASGEIGVQPEWFYKGDGSVLRAHNDVLEIPPYACDGGDEPEIAGAYLIGPGGEPCRVGLTMGNEFSDHKMEKMNYLYLAPSKLRNCSIGPELTIGAAAFYNAEGTVAIHRERSVLWQAAIFSGEKNMSFSLANIEHHHFKYDAHRRPGDCHIHFFGADAFSFGEGLALEDGDTMEVSFTQFGRPLRNRLQIVRPPEQLVKVTLL